MLYILLCLCCLCVWLLCKKKGARDPPGLPGGLPFIGHGLLLVGDSIKTYNNVTWISEESLKRGGIVLGYLGCRKVYCITDPDAIVTVSNACIEKEYMYGFAKAFVGDGLITSNGAIWKKHRKLLNPAFSQKVLDSFIQCFNNQAKALVHQIALQLDKPFDYEPLLRQNNLESICLTTTGVGGKEYTNLQQKYLQLIPKFQMVLYRRFKQVWFHSDFFYNFSNLKKEEDDILKSCAHLSNQIIKKRKEDMETKYKKLGQDRTGTVKPFLERILNISKENRCFTDEQIRHETDTIIAAGHETSATCLNLALIALGSYPEMQQKVFNEVIQVLENLQRDLNKEDLKKLIYTEAVIKETLRLYPVVPVVARNIDKDIKLKNYDLKANSACFLFFHGLNRHPKWGPDARQFRPERWLDYDTLPSRNYFGSFSIGKRNCIGKAYAMMSMKATLAHIIRSYEISADINKVVFKWHMLTYPASGHHYILRKRLKS